MIASEEGRYNGFLPGKHLITAIGGGGFTFAEMSHRGSIIALPSGIHIWKPPSPFVHDEALYAGVFDEAKKIDLLLIGTGTRPIPLPLPLRWRFQELRISAEPMQTSVAASTYNVLLQERRRVAVALAAVN